MIILAIAIVFFGYAISVNNSNQSHNAVAISDDSIDINQSYPDGPTAEAKIDTSNVNSQLLGENDLGSVELLGPFGNPDSDIKIAYSIGMHPLESKAHKALFDTVKSKSDSLNYCYYIYKINVTNYNTDDEGRMDGQLLAQEFVAPHIINNDYDLSINKYKETEYIPVEYPSTAEIMADLHELEMEITKGLAELEEML